MHRFVSVLVGLLALAGVVVLVPHQHVVALRGTSAATRNIDALEAVTAGQPRDAVAHIVHTPAHAPVAHLPKPTPKPAHTSSASASLRHTSTHTATHQYPSGPTSWGALNAAIARIPTYHAGDARWVIKNTGWWGTAIWESDVIYISPTVPENRLYDVAVHEWSHLLTVHAYGGSVALAVAATTAYFGGTGLYGAEYAADCMAILQGADWTNYTPCTSARWRAGARDLIDGRQLPGVTAR
jgi:hypothetical protein